MLDRIRLVAAALLVAGLSGGPSPARAAPEPFGRLDVDQVEALLGAKDVRIFDVNSAQVYREGHVPGAVLAELGDEARTLPADKTLRLVYYCKNGH